MGGFKQQLDKQQKAIVQEMNLDAKEYSHKLNTKKFFELQEKEQNHQMTSKEKKEYKKQQKILMEQLSVDTEAAGVLSDVLDEDTKTQLENQNREIEDRAGKDKAKDDCFGSKRRKAEKLLKQRKALKRSRYERKTKGMVQLAKANESTGAVASFLTEMFNGTEADRTAAITPMKSTRQYDSETIHLQKNNISYNTTCLTPTEGWNRETGKVVIFFSGSGEPGLNENVIRVSMDAFAKMGAKVYHFDYRGYGNTRVTDRTGNPLEHHLTEKSLYEDGENIVSLIKAKENIPNSQIVLYGYSLGGAVASRVAANLSQNNMLKEKEHVVVNENEKLGGLVLDSPMRSLKYAANRTAIASGYLASPIAGKYSSKEHLMAIAESDPNMPIQFMGGSQKDDFLSPKNTKVHKIRGLNNTNLQITDANHFDAHALMEDNIGEILNTEHRSRLNEVI